MATEALTWRSLVKLDTKDFKRAIKGADKINVLLKTRAVAQEQGNQEYVDYITKQMDKLVKNLQQEEDMDEFKRLVQLETRYTTLNRYARGYQNNGDDARLRVVNRRLQQLAKNGDLKTRRRKEGTGKRVEKTFVYNDTPSNRKLERVGKEYKKWVWEDAEYEEIERKIRRRRAKKRTAEEGLDEPEKKKRRNLWIEAITQAKTELKAPAFLIVRREVKDPNDKTQKMGVKVYERAVQIMAKLKEEQQNN